jgi:hypothetical protein
MRGYFLRRMIMFLPLIVVFVALLGFVVMSLWNWLMPSIFGLGTITYWQAWGLLILGRLLMGGFRMGGHGGSPRWRRRVRERWAHMSPEEREKFRRGMWGRYAPPEPPGQPGQ